MKTKIILNSLFGLVIGLVLFVPGSLAGAFGVSPPWITNDNLKPGSNFVYIIDLSTNSPSADMWVKSEVTGDPEILKWVTVRDKDNLAMPAGLQHVPMYVDVNIPADARLGKYNGDIGLTVVPKSQQTENIAIYLGGHINVELTVTNRDIMDYSINSSTIEPISEGQPVTLDLSVKNLGNMPVSAIKTKVEVKDKDGKLIATGTGDQLTSTIYPHTNGDVKITIPTSVSLAGGTYWTNITMYKDSKSVYQNKLYLTVNPINVNNVLKTAVNVGNEAELKTAAADITVPTPFAPVVQQAQPENNVRVKTTVTVRAPLTNQLIGVVIILLGILIIITARMEIGIFKKLRHKKY